MLQLGKRGHDFIVEEETGGKSYYEKQYKSSFIWPEGDSGCTAMVGIDIGYYTEAEVNHIFQDIVSGEQLKRIQGGRGKIRGDAESYVKKLKDIKFPWDVAISKFDEIILPKFSGLTMKVFPGVDKLRGGAQAALLSLVFNRGTSLKGDSRREMLRVRNLVPKADYAGIAKAIRDMKRLWPTGGLAGRREREAKLVLES